MSLFGHCPEDLDVVGDCGRFVGKRVGERSLVVSPSRWHPEREIGEDERVELAVEWSE